jgi:hypothetical protein
MTVCNNSSINLRKTGKYSLKSYHSHYIGKKNRIYTSNL